MFRMTRWPPLLSLGTIVAAFTPPPPLTPCPVRYCGSRRARDQVRSIRTWPWHSNGRVRHGAGTCAMSTSSSSNEATTFRTVLRVPPLSPRIKHSDSLLFVGSCFTENIGQRFEVLKWRTIINPFGITYNPVSIAACVGRLVDGARPYTRDDLRLHQGRYFSFDHHSVFSHPDPEQCLEGINRSLEQAGRALGSTDVVVVTLGTAWAYRLKETGLVVSNCHKLPQSDFEKVLLGVDETSRALDGMVSGLRQVTNRRVRVVFTVSPVRHIRDGVVENSRGKAHLLAAVHQVVDQHPGCAAYFPAYEIVMDDLRDYRFMGSDLVHPSEVAVDYIWQALVEAYIDPAARGVMADLGALRRALAHRPFHPEGEAHQAFVRAQLGKLEALQQRLPYADLQAERGALQAQLVLGGGTK